MGFLNGRGSVPKDARRQWEIETVARLRRVGDHPAFEVVIQAINLVLARMAGELAADAAGKPAPAPSVLVSMRQVLEPLASGAGEAGLGKVYASEAEQRKAIADWAITGERPEAAE